MPEKLRELRSPDPKTSVVQSPELRTAIAETRRYIFVVGGVCSSIGKGITAASIGKNLQAQGLNTTIVKLDPYLNADAGTMSPVQHGEVFVTDDGAEVDLDLGHYERFLDKNLSGESSLTMGQIYGKVLNKERSGEYLGRTVQVIPHVTDEIKKRLMAVGNKSNADCVIVECGGTVGDIEAGAPLEAIRQLRFELPSTALVFVSYAPFLDPPGEIKTKPTQLATHLLQQNGLRPDLMVVRLDRGDFTPEMTDSAMKKVALFANLSGEAVIPFPPLGTVYEAPLYLSRLNALKVLEKKLGLPETEADLKDWESIVSAIKSTRSAVSIAIVGKYMEMEDSYISLYEALKAAGLAVDRSVDIQSLDSALLEGNDHTTWEKLRTCSGVIVPGGFGIRGTEGKIAAANYAFESKVPYLGICLGMHTMSIALARKLLNDSTITSAEFDDHGVGSDKNHVIHYLPGQKGASKGGSMRLGANEINVLAGTKLANIYGMPEGGIVRERHRHRLEFNNAFREPLQKKDVSFSGLFSERDLVEAMEVPKHPFMLGVQYHPELISRPNRPHPLFVNFLEAAIKRV